MNAHDELGDLLLRTGIHADQMVDLLTRVRKEQRAQFRDDSIPTWEAAYDSATFTPYLIGYCNDEVSAKAAALAYYRSQVETDDTLDWEPDPQMAVREWDQWHTLIRTRADGMVLATDIVVRRRREDAAETQHASFTDAKGDGWVSCSRSGCSNAERLAKATERGWQHRQGAWRCSRHTEAGEAA